MSRFLVFATLFPPLSLLVGMAAIPEARSYLDTSFLLWMLGLAYVVCLVPALVTAAADRALSASHFIVRLIGTAIAGTISIMAAVVAFNFTEMLFAPVVVLIALMGAMPAVICSCLAEQVMKRNTLAVI